MPRLTDENYQPAPSKKKLTGAPFATQADIQTRDRKSVERDIVKLLIKIFRLNPKIIGEAVKNETGEFDYLMAGVHLAYSPKFPAALHVANPKRGRGEVFTLNRLLRHPEKYTIIRHFLTLPAKNLQGQTRPSMLAGSHPRLGLLTVTDLKMEPDILCFQFSISTDSEDRTRTKTLVLADIKHLLHAIHRQGIWQPEAR